MEDWEIELQETQAAIALEQAERIEAIVSTLEPLITIYWETCVNLGVTNEFAPLAKCVLQFMEYQK